MSELRTNRQALVIGGSMAGLLAARVLADHFSQVTILERDRFPDGPAFLTIRLLCLKCAREKKRVSAQWTILVM